MQLALQEEVGRGDTLEEEKGNLIIWVLPSTVQAHSRWFINAFALLLPVAREAGRPPSK